MEVNVGIDTPRLSKEDALMFLRNLETTLKEIKPFPREVVLDFSKVEFIDAQGLGVLNSLNSFIKANKGKMKITNPKKRTRDLFAISHLDKSLNIE